jgi:hypothetical protein
LFNPRYSRFSQSDLRLRFGIGNRQLLNRELALFTRMFPGFKDDRLWHQRNRESLQRSYRARHPAPGNMVMPANQS